MKSIVMKRATASVLAAVVISVATCGSDAETMRRATGGIQARRAAPQTATSSAVSSGNVFEKNASAFPINPEKAGSSSGMAVLFDPAGRSDNSSSMMTLPGSGSGVTSLPGVAEEGSGTQALSGGKDGGSGKQALSGGKDGSSGTQGQSGGKGGSSGTQGQSGSKGGSSGTQGQSGDKDGGSGKQAPSGSKGGSSGTQGQSGGQGSSSKGSGDETFTIPVADGGSTHKQDQPYDINAIRQKVIRYAAQKEMIYNPDLTINNNGYDPPIDVLMDTYDEADLVHGIEEEIDFLIRCSRNKTGGDFNLYFAKRSDRVNDYWVYVLH